MTHLADVHYLSGFTGSSGVLLLTAKGARLRSQLLTDGRYTVQARAEVKASTVRICRGPALVEAAKRAALSGAKRCGFVADVTSVANADLLRRTVRDAFPSQAKSDAFFRPVPNLVAPLRQVKDEAEIAVLRRAALLTCRLYEEMLVYIEAGMREIDVAAELEYRARKAGAHGMSFETIVAGGERSSLPHGRATAARLRPGDLLTLDFGIMLEGYCSDMTRTVLLGRGRRAKLQMRDADEKRRVFEAVHEAQASAVAAIEPGITCHAVDEAARSVLARAGLAKAFTHSTGHGLGLEIHEGPRLAAKQEQELRAGMVITVEPGAYLPGKWGVRIEDTVLVTETGAEILTPVFKGWTEL